MDDVRNSLSRFKKDIKLRLKGKKRAPDGIGSNVTGETANPSDSLLRPGPRVAASGHDGEGNRTSTVTSQIHFLRDRPASEGHNDPQNVYSSPPSPPSLKGETDSSWTVLSLLPCLIIPSDTTEPGAAENKKSTWKSTTYASAKLLLTGVRDSADAFGPLKSVAGGLCFILENFEVRSSAWIDDHSSYGDLSERRQTNEQSSRWHLGSNHLLNCSVCPLPRTMTRSKRGERT